MKHTKITQRERFQMGKIGPEGFPPCGDMVSLIKRLEGDGLKIGGSVLDAGCGQCRFGRYLSQLTPITSVLGVDQSGEAISIARARRPGRVENKLEFRNEEIDTFLKSNNNKFSIVGAFNILEYVDKPGQTLSRLQTSVKTNGFLVGSVYLGEILPDAKNAWETVEEFQKDFPKLTVVDMNKNLGCIVFIYHKIKGRKT